MSEEKTFDLAAEAEAIISEGESESGSTEVESSDVGQAEAPAQESQESSLSPEDALNQLDKEEVNPEAEKAFLDQINTLGLVHKGAPVQIENQKQLVELIQKGFDYTQKTMAHANEVKAKEEEFSKLEASFKEKETQLAQWQTEVSDQLIQNNILSQVVSEIQKADPELFEHLDALYRKQEGNLALERQFQAKYDGKIKEVTDKFQSLEQKLASEQLGKIKSGWEQELEETQAEYAAKLAKLGVKPNWDQVKEIWASDSTGKMKVREALLASHGEAILKANESYRKMLETKNKTQQKFVHRSGVGASSRAEPSVKAEKGESLDAYLRRMSENI